MRPCRRLPNKALQQTRSALTTIAAALAAERRCSPNAPEPGRGMTESRLPAVEGRLVRRRDD